MLARSNAFQVIDDRWFDMMIRGNAAVIVTDLYNNRVILEMADGQAWPDGIFEDVGSAMAGGQVAVLASSIDGDIPRVEAVAVNHKGEQIRGSLGWVMENASSLEPEIDTVEPPEGFS